MDGEIVAFGGGNPEVLSGGEGYAALPVPTVIAREGERAAQRFIEFFTANIRSPDANPHEFSPNFAGQAATLILTTRQLSEAGLHQRTQFL